MKDDNYLNEIIKESINIETAGNVQDFLCKICDKMGIKFFAIYSSKEEEPLLLIDRNDHVVTKLFMINDEFKIIVHDNNVPNLFLSLIFSLVKPYLLNKRTQEEFVSTISHEFRTPLNAIIGSSYSFAKSNPNNEEIITINKNSIKLLSLINDITSYKEDESLSSLNSNDSILQEEFNIDELIYTVYNGFEEAGLTLDYKRKTNDVTVFSDYKKLTKVLTKVINNSIKFNDNDIPNIKVDVTTNSSLMTVSIKDNGTGIESDFIRNVFEGFCQEDSGDCRKFNGVGLGLCTARKTIEGLGGSINIESEGKEQGCTVTISFPFKSEKKIISKFNGEILLIDDDEINQVVTKKYLNDLGFNVDVSVDGIHGIEMFKKNKFKYNCVIMDCQMPNMDGYHCTKLIREINKTIPILGFSANALSSNKDKCLNSGMNCLLLKPINDDVFKKTFKNLLPMCFDNLHTTQLDTFKDNDNSIFLSNLLQKFLNQLKSEDFMFLESCLDKQSWFEMAGRFHKLKSTFGTFGFNKTQDLLKELQEKETFVFEDYALFRSFIRSDICSLKEWATNNNFVNILENINSF